MVSKKKQSNSLLITTQTNTERRITISLSLLFPAICLVRYFVHCDLLTLSNKYPSRGRGNSISYKALRLIDRSVLAWRPTRYNRLLDNYWLPTSFRTSEKGIEHFIDGFTWHCCLFRHPLIWRHCMRRGHIDQFLLWLSSLPSNEKTR